MRRLLTLGWISAISFASAAPPLGSNWKLVWSDEFDRPGAPDKTKWSYEEGLVRNHEGQYYTLDRRENARVEGGMLIIEGRKETFADRDGKHSAGYTSASLTTEKKASWTYGRFEIRAKLPTAKGVWPALWMLGSDIRSAGWPQCGEIDIMEFIGRLPEDIHGSVHYSKDGKHVSDGRTTPVQNPGKEFHVYALEWGPDTMDYFLDDKKYYSFAVKNADDAQGNPFRKPQYLILNFALGGEWGGPIDDAALPQQLVIDYVRVYQKPPLAPPPQVQKAQVQPPPRQLAQPLKQPQPPQQSKPAEAPARPGA